MMKQQVLISCNIHSACFNIAPIVCVDFYEPSVKVAFVDGRKGQRNKICRPEVDWVISQAGQPEGQPNRTKPTALRGAVGVWDCENSDRIKGL